MHVEWFGQSTFRLVAEGTTIVIDPFGDMSGLAGRGLRFDYPPLTGVTADLLLVTHEHRDHNAVEVVGGDPVTLRSRAGTFDSPVGEVVGVASEHDDVAGTARGANVMFRFTAGGVRVAHLGDLGQAALRDEQVAALGPVDQLLAPCGGGPTIGGVQADAIARRLGARWVVPMHHRTPRINFLESADALLARADLVAELEAPSFDLTALPACDGLLAVVPAAP
jgi:L-ascorbate metabolism protein UlaG (beta-lactamase superfamily)